MTKQERIEEMANYIAKCCPDKVDDGCFDKNMNCVSCIAMELYNAGYRKEDEVRKETAKEILQTIMDIIKKSDCFLSQEVVRILAKNSGVEVEE